MNTYAIHYSIILVGCLDMEAKSKTDALRKMDEIKDIDLIDPEGQVIDLEIHSVDRH
jgi:hypothetical protein